MKKFNAFELAVSPELSAMANQSQAMLKSHVNSFTRKDGAFVAAHDDKRTKAQESASGGEKAKLTPSQVDAITKKHKMVGKGPEWKHDGDKVPASEVSHVPEFSHKEVYGHEDETSPAASDFAKDFAGKGHQGFVLKHPDGKRSLVDTQGYGYARYHAPVDDAKGGEAEKGAEGEKPKAPGFGDQHEALAASSKEGEYDHETNQAAAAYMKAGDHVGLKTKLKVSDTAARDHILDHVHPDHWEGLGYNPLNKDKSVGEYDKKFPAKAAKPAKPAKPAKSAGSDGQAPKLPKEHSDLMQESLSNDEASSDQELADHWKSEGVHPDHADAAIKHRDAFLKMSPADAKLGKLHEMMSGSAAPEKKKVPTGRGFPKQANVKDTAEAGAAVRALQAKSKAGGDGPAEGEVGHEEHKAYGKYFKKGDKVKDGGGKTHEVISHIGPSVHTSGGAFHPTKLEKVGSPMAKALLFTSPDQTPVLQALTKAHIKTYTRKDGVTVKAHDTRIEAHGVKGMKSTPWRKVFKSPEHFEQWSEKDGGDHQVLGYRELAEPAAAGADLPVASKVPAAVKTVTDLLGGEEWTHSEGSSHNPHGRRSGSRGLATDEALVANGFAATGSTDDSDTFTHPEGHVAVNTQHGITITHAKEAKEAPAPSLAASSVTVDGEDRYEFAHGKKPGGKGGTYMFSPQKSHDFGSGSSVAGEDYFQSAYGAGYSESKAAAKKWAAGKGHSRIHVQT